MSVLQRSAVAFEAIVFSIAIALAISSPADAGCFGSNKNQNKYGCEEDENSGSFSLFGSSLFGSSEDSQDSIEQSPESVDQPLIDDSTNSFSGSFEEKTAYSLPKGPKRTIVVLDFENKVTGI